MLINKVEADQRLIDQANDLRLSLCSQLSVKKEDKGAQAGCPNDYTGVTGALTDQDS